MSAKRPCKNPFYCMVVTYMRNEKKQIFFEKKMHVWALRPLTAFTGSLPSKYAICYLLKASDDEYSERLQCINTQVERQSILAWRPVSHAVPRSNLHANVRHRQHSECRAVVTERSTTIGVQTQNILSDRKSMHCAVYGPYIRVTGNDINVINCVCLNCLRS
jgi:hypothetical protein